MAIVVICAVWLKRRTTVSSPVGPSPSGLQSTPDFSRHFCIRTEKMDGHEHARRGSDVGTACLPAVRLCDEAHMESSRDERANVHTMRRLRPRETSRALGGPKG